MGNFTLHPPHPSAFPLSSTKTIMTDVDSHPPVDLPIPALPVTDSSEETYTDKKENEGSIEMNALDAYMKAYVTQLIQNLTETVRIQQDTQRKKTRKLEERVQEMEETISTLTAKCEANVKYEMELNNKVEKLRIRNELLKEMNGRPDQEPKSQIHFKAMSARLVNTNNDLPDLPVLPKLPKLPGEERPSSKTPSANSHSRIDTSVVLEKPSIKSELQSPIEISKLPEPIDVCSLYSQAKSVVVNSRKSDYFMPFLFMPDFLFLNPHKYLSENNISSPRFNKYWSNNKLTIDRVSSITDNYIKFVTATRDYLDTWIASQDNRSDAKISGHQLICLIQAFIPHDILIELKREQPRLIFVYYAKRFYTFPERQRDYANAMISRDREEFEFFDSFQGKLKQNSPLERLTINILCLNPRAHKDLFSTYPTYFTDDYYTPHTLDALAANKEQAIEIETDIKLKITQLFRKYGHLVKETHYSQPKKLNMPWSSS